MKLRALSVFCLAFVACQDDGTGPVPPPPTRIAVLDSSNRGAFHLGDSIKLVAYRLDWAGLPILADSVRFDWSSSDTTVFTVDTGGTVAVVGLGSAEVIAQLRDTTAVSASLSGDTASGRTTFKATYTVIDPGPVISGSLSYYFDCLLRESGQVFCRGTNSAGELGDGTINDSPDWVAVSGGHVFTSMSGGEHHTCGLTPDNRVFCWGRGHHGQMGTGTISSVNSTPVEATGDHRWSSLSAGGHGQTCAIEMTTAVPYCWGHNDFGQVGRDPTVANDPAVAPISGSHLMRDIQTTNFYTCGLETDGAVYCSGFWGIPTNTVYPDPYTGQGTGTPNRIRGTEPLETIAVGYSHGCGLNAANAAFCWGDNWAGQGGTGDYLEPGDIRPVIGAPAFRSIHTPVFASCGITDAGDAWCWGGNGTYALGRTDRAMKTAIPQRLKLDTKLRWIRSGDEDRDHTCAITESGALICWGGGY